MVIHDETELVVKLPMIKKPLFEDKSYVIPNKNEDHENTNENNAPMSIPLKRSRKLSINESDVQVRIPRKKSKKTKQSPVYPTEDSDTTTRTYEIDEGDLEELRTVYKKCKSVIRKIEAKYGHLLDLDEPDSSRNRRKTTTNSTDDEKGDCQCSLNKKIVFDDDGNEIVMETVPAEHMCPKKQSYLQSQVSQPSDLQIEYYNESIQLPDSLQELKVILQNPEIEITYRNQVIQKVRLIRQEFLNELKFNKCSIIEKIKANMEEMIDFKGTNLSSLPGYVY